MKITFLGAAGEVTGSCSLLEIGTKKFLVDCGMFQGGEFNATKNYDPLAFDPKELTAVLVTHAHLDHVGRLPLLIKGGFTGPIYTTPATAKLAVLILEDALEVMAYDNEKQNKPLLYDHTDIMAVATQFKPIDYYNTTVISSPNTTEETKVTFYDSGHIFGAAFIGFEAEGKKVVFSGDIGNINVPILRNTDPLPTALDALVCESTYGDRLHENAEDRQTILKKLITEAIARGGVLLIPSFSLERTQELLYSLNDLMIRKREIAPVPIFLDSPLAIDALMVYREFPEYYDEEAERFFKQGEDLFEFPGLQMCRTREESKKINSIPGQKIIIAGAGMMNGGRILHHALRYLSDEKNTLLITGFQAQGTLGRQILEGESPVKVMDETVKVRCQIKSIGALSAHADQKKLISWVGASKVKQVFLNHGEPETSVELARKMKEEGDINADVAVLGKTVEV
jgi:metallo-beta-lactamase family protein